MNRCTSPVPTHRNTSMPPPAPRRRSKKEILRDASDDICMILGIEDELRQEMVFAELSRRRSRQQHATVENIQSIIVGLQQETMGVLWNV